MVDTEGHYYLPCKKSKEIIELEHKTRQGVDYNQDILNQNYKRILN